ncbi:hypothetical protein [Pseudotabrizicola sediminis]|uniref:hypothetical protein n=1 Tax=Pseudotabrizicola sediminis TaxID=2486418 RepID=UPI001AEC2FE1|nr:hypothetical protein [Pseudotabrizicola sediminis]
MALIVAKRMTAFQPFVAQSCSSRKSLLPLRCACISVAAHTPKPQPSVASAPLTNGRAILAIKVFLLRRHQPLA